MTITNDTVPAQLYDEQFFAHQWQEALESARLVVPVLLKLVQPRNVVDFGCGLGAWLKAFEENGIGDITGLDGTYVDRSKLLIAVEHFRPANLYESVALDRRYDLAVCLEVAEHLPKERATGLVADLAAAAPIVLFSGAIPRQGGTGHINEQWPAYWSALFARHGYQPVDALRPRLRDERSIAFWYRQNILLYVESSELERRPALQIVAQQHDGFIEDWVYADLYRSALEELKRPLSWRRLVREINLLPGRALRRIFG